MERKETVTFPCEVCHDSATGYHFGANTCEGCKSFFVRTCEPLDEKTSLSEQYVAPRPKTPLPVCKSGSNNCNLSGGKRKTCRNCRWRRCIGAKMSRTQSRYGRPSQAVKANDGRRKQVGNRYDQNWTAMYGQNSYEQNNTTNATATATAQNNEWTQKYDPLFLDFMNQILQTPDEESIDTITF